MQLIVLRKSIRNVKGVLKIPKQGKHVIISVMGPYAGESESSIFTRKRREINENGFTFWHHQSYQAKPDMVQELGKAAEGSPIKLILTSTGSKKRGEDTKKHAQAKKFSPKKYSSYKPIPKSIYVETGTRPWAIVITNLVLEKKEINLWDYSNYFTGGAIITRQGGSTVCAIRQSSRDDPMKMKSKIRDVVAIADVIHPFSVWLV